MGLVSKPKLEGLGLDDQFPLTVRGTKQKRMSSLPFKKKWFTINGTQSTLLSNKEAIRWFPSYIYARSVFFTYGKNYRVFQAFFYIISKIFNIVFWSVWKRCFSPVVLKVVSQNTCSDQLYVSFNSDVWQDIYIVSFLCCYLSFCSELFSGYYFKGCCCKTNVCDYRRYQILTWKCSNFF